MKNNNYTSFLWRKEIEKEMLLPSHVVTKEMAEETAGQWQ